MTRQIGQPVMVGREPHDASPGGPEAPKKYRAGTHRAVSPAETLKWAERFFDAAGITRVADITGLDVIGIPVVTVCRPNSRSVVVSLGKGLDVAAAKASGVMESIEAFMAERIDQPLLLGSFNDLRSGHSLVDVDRLPRTTESLYHPDFPILWIEGRELFTGTRTWVPYEMVHTEYTLPVPSGTGCFVAASNGLASGNHLLEAISHGICETVERDAATLHEVRAAQEKAARRVDPRTVDDPGCGEALQRLDRAGMSVGIWEITTDIGIPVFRSLIAEGHRGPALMMGSAEGMGCHPDKGVALLRALTEAAQDRLAVISGARDEPGARDYYSQESEPDLRPGQAADLAGGPARDFTAAPTFGSDSSDADVEWELGRLRSAGVGEVVVVDLTRAEFAIPVVRVIVPGLEGPVMTVRSCRLGPRAMDLMSDDRPVVPPRPAGHGPDEHR